MDRRAPRNVWVGTSVEDQSRADERIPHLLQIPARIRFLSCEPLLGPVDLTTALPFTDRHCQRCGFRPIEGIERYREIHRDKAKCVSCGWDMSQPAQGVDWVIIGGESGPGARPCNVQWIRSLVAQCKAAGVPVFVKQLGAYPIDNSRDSRFMIGAERVHMTRDRKGGDPSEWPEDLRVREFPQVSGAGTATTAAPATSR
jgi:hypothetical protein